MRSQLRTFSSSVREKELNFYSNLADWWAPNGPQQQLHMFNKVRVNFIRKELKQHTDLPFSSLKALDIGCGAGLLSESLGRLGLQVKGIDPTPNCI